MPGHRLLCATLGLLLLLGGCGSRESMGDSSLRVLGAGVVNDPANKSLRFDMLKFGLDRFCEEMMKAGAPLKLSDQEPVLGRFFAESCQSQVVDDEARKTFVVQYTGKGYAWTNVSGKLGFSSRGLVEYAPDFQLSDGALYVYFRPKTVDAAAFQLLAVDSALAQAGIAAAATGNVNPDEIGRHVLDSQLRRGFTVIRYGSDGHTDFGLGFIPKGQKPFKPFEITTEKQILVNERTEVHAATQDYIGPLTVTDDDQALHVTLELDGADKVDYQLVPKAMGDAMLDRYVRTQGPCPTLGPPSFDGSAGRARTQQAVPLPVGQYFLVLDNSAALGQSQPPAGAVGDHAARVDYTVLLGDR